MTELDEWRTAALLKDRTRVAIRERVAAGDSQESIAGEYGVPVAFVAHLCAWQLFRDDVTADPPSVR